MRVKQYLYVSLLFTLISALFGFCYYLSFKNALLHYNRETIEQNTKLLNELLQYSGKSEELLLQLLEEQTEEFVETSVLQETLQMNASYFLETCYMHSQITEREQLALPSFMIGLDKKELTAYVDGYMENMPINEFLDGLVSYEIVSFGPNQVVLRKTYDEQKIENQFYLCSLSGFVVVYYSDLKTIYEYTEISCETLTPEIQLLIENGFYVKDAKELYSILEGYTS